MEVIQGQRKHIEGCIEINEECYGNGGTSLPKRIPDSMDTTYEDLFVIMEGEKVVGFVRGATKTPAVEHIKYLGEKEDSYFCVLSVCVRKEYRKLGYGKKLMQFIIGRAKKRQIVFGEVVKPKNKPEAISGLIFKELGFKRVVEIPEYWKEKSKEAHLYCNECDDYVCECGAVLYSKKI